MFPPPHGPPPPPLLSLLSRLPPSPLILLGLICSALVPPLFPPLPSLVSVLWVQMGLTGPKLSSPSVLETPAE